MDFPQLLWSYSPSLNHFQPTYFPYETIYDGNSYLSDDFAPFFPASNDAVAQGIPREWEYSISSSTIQSVQDPINGQDDQKHQKYTESFESSLTIWGQVATDIRGDLSCVAPDSSSQNDQLSIRHDSQEVTAPVKTPSQTLRVRRRYFWVDLLKAQDKLTLPGVVQGFCFKPEECKGCMLKGFSCKDDLKRHVREIHQPKSVVCPNCGTELVRLQPHRKTCTGKKRKSRSTKLEMEMRRQGRKTEIDIRVEK